ncbi:right-handed parallel beta-helix repeat-containing protein [Kineococcus sp. G2]|uniref:right-handed parallel beta-helix repeat-containing protein n=1 Tax=Kineococcus sp. G2 TaxID=3127484 RepID=UPI00301E12B4
MAPEGVDGFAVQRAIDAVHEAGGGTVQLAAGTTYLAQRHLLLRSAVALVGAGPSTVVKAGPRFLDTRGPHDGYPLLTTDGAQDVRIADLTADQSGDLLDGNVENRLHEYLVDIRRSERVVVERVSTVNPFSYSIASVGSTDFTIRQCRTSVRTSGRYTQLDGIHVLDSSHGLVEDNDVDQGGPGRDGDDALVAHTMGRDCHHVVYRGNRARSGRYGGGMQLALGDGDIHDITVVGNLFHDSPSGVRVGDYGGGGVVRNITIGGDRRDGNVFARNARFAVQLRTRVGGGVHVSHNTSIGSGAFLLPEGATGTGNLVR